MCFCGPVSELQFPAAEGAGHSWPEVYDAGFTVAVRQELRVAAPGGARLVSPAASDRRAAAFSSSRSASSWAEPMCSIFRDPRWDE